MIMKELEQQEIEKLRMLFNGEGTRLVFNEAVKSLYNQDYNVFPIFDLDMCYNIANVSDAEQYLTGNIGTYQDADFKPLQDEIKYGVKNENTEGFPFDDIDYEQDRLSDIVTKNYALYEVLESKQNDLLRLAFQASPEDVFYMNYKMYNYWTVTLK